MSGRQTLDDAVWRRLLTASNDAVELPPPWDAILGPLGRAACPDGLIIAQLGQSLDGRIATITGESRYINGDDALAHLHRLRALVDGVVVGIGTALADDPLLTVRHVSGDPPARIVIDPRGRLHRDARLLADDGALRVVLTGPNARPDLPSGVHHLALPCDGTDGVGQMDPARIVAALGELGLHRLLIEGGAATLSRFLAAGCLDRLHVMVAPIVIGSGRLGFDLTPVGRLDACCRPPTAMHVLGSDVLFDCVLDRNPYPGIASRST